MKPDPLPRRTIPHPDEVWVRTGAALKRFIDRYELTQRQVAEVIGMSQPHVSFLVGNHPRESARSLTFEEALRLELWVRAEINPDLVLGEIARDAGLVEDTYGHPVDVTYAYPRFGAEAREVIADLMVRSEERYIEKVGDPDQLPPVPARLVRGVPEPRRRSKSDGSKGPRAARTAH